MFSIKIYGTIKIYVLRDTSRKAHLVNNKIPKAMFHFLKLSFFILGTMRCLFEGERETRREKINIDLTNVYIIILPALFKFSVYVRVLRGLFIIRISFQSNHSFKHKYFKVHFRSSQKMKMLQNFSIHKITKN